MSESQHHHVMKERLEHLKTLRDEIRVDLHLAGMEARTRWEDLEPMARDAELLTGEVSELAREQLEALIARLRALREELHHRARSARRPPP